MPVGDALAPLRAVPDAWRGGVREVRRAWRLVRVVVHIATGFALALVTGAVFSPHRPVVRHASRWWLGRLTGILNVEIRVRGVPCAMPALFVSNHVSWLDIPVLGGAAPVHFLSKAEVAQWPVLGPLVTAAGTLYIRRGHGQVSERARQIAGHIADGRPILVFPEGTTTDGQDVRTFHAQLFAAATGGKHAVQPVALRYREADGSPDAITPFLGDDTFQAHLWRLLGKDVIRVDVTFLPPITPAGEDHRALAATAHARVRAAVGAVSLPQVESARAG